MTHTAIPEDELKVFESLEDINVVFDVGSRDDVDYLIIKPNIELHAFEPNPLFFEELKAQLKDRPNVYLNNYGLGDMRGSFYYNDGQQSFDGSEFWNGETGVMYPIKTLDWYVRQYNIDRIDFLKLDTEGYEYKILKGGQNALKITRYLQYEGGGESKPDERFYDLLGNDFEFDYLGGRNIICTRKGQKRPWIPEEPKEGGLQEKTDKNRL